MTYSRIQPYPNSAEFDFPELRALSTVWLEKKAGLEGNASYREFIKKMQREWAIETGIIERLYTWDRGVTEILIEQGIEASIIAYNGGIPREEATHIQSLISDHLDIVKDLFSSIKNNEPLTEHFIRGLQAQFTEHQEFTEALTSAGTLIQVPLIKGDYKKLPNNPRRGNGEVHYYCPPELTKEQMESLIAIYRKNEAQQTPEVNAAWLHHRFTQIHPFQDGNGRVARTLASLVFLKAGLFPLVIKDSDRKVYINALESADDGDLKPLITLFAKRERESILKALGLEQQVQQSQFSDQIITSALQVLKDKFSTAQAELPKVYEYAKELFAIAETRLNEMASSLDVELRKLTPPGKSSSYHAHSNSANNHSPQRNYFQYQIVEIAKRLDYYVNSDRQRAWVRLSITTEEVFEYVLSFHGYGFGETGILAVSPFIYQKVPREDGGTEVINLHRASLELFQFNYAESIETTKARFEEWLENSLTIALAEWKNSL